MSEREQTLPSAVPWLPGAFFLLLVLLGFGAALLTPETYRLPAEGSLLRGERTARYEEAFNEALPFREAAISTWGVLEYVLFKEGRQGVFVGEDGWLFTDEEFAFYPQGAAETARKLARIERVQARLEAQGIELVVALLPAKARVYPEKLGRYELPSYARGRYERLLQALHARGVRAPDLLSPLLEAKGQRAVFLRTDTHWTPFGAEVVARELADALRGADLPGLFTARYETERTGQERLEGDLLTFIPLGPFEELGPAPDRLERRATQPEGESAASLGLFGEQEIPVALVGTSYSADARWNFGGALKEALGADVLNVAEEGRGPMRPMRAYLASAEFQETPPQVVVWEVPERFFPAPEEMNETP